VASGNYAQEINKLFEEGKELHNQLLEFLQRMENEGYIKVQFKHVDAIENIGPLDLPEFEITDKGERNFDYVEKSLQEIKPVLDNFKRIISQILVLRINAKKTGH
jgi:DNA-binding PadR family transcriptional regulator